MSNQQVQQLIHDLQTGNVQQRRAASYRLGKSGITSIVPFLTKEYNDFSMGFIA